MEYDIIWKRFTIFVNLFLYIDEYEKVFNYTSKYSFNIISLLVRLCRAKAT